MTAPDDRIARLEERLQRAEDQLEITNLIAAYGPLVDSGDGDGAAALWTQDGVYDVDTGVYEGQDGISAMVESGPHQQLIGRGCAHVTSPPRIVLQGDLSIAITHSQLIGRDQQGGFVVLRATAHRWELTRTSAGWRVARRTSRLLDGSAAARELLRKPADLS